MKKRLLAWLLALTLVTSLLPVVAQAETTGEGSDADTGAESSGVVVLNTDGTVQIDDVSYRLYLGQGTQRADGSLGYWLDYVNRGFIPGETAPVNEFRYYLFLRGADNAEATEAVYNQFWAACQMEDVAVTVNGQSDTSGITFSEIRTHTDNYHKYVSVSVTGERGGTISVAIKHTDGTAYTITKRFQYTVATKLTSDTNSYSFSVDAGESKFYYIDLGSTQRVTVSGALGSADMFGRLVLAQTAEGTGETILWRHFEGMSAAASSQFTLTTDKILLRAQNLGSVSVTGTVTVEAEQPKLMYRSMSYNGSAWVEDSAFYDLSAVTMGLGQLRRMRLYYGTSADAQRLTGGTFTSGDSAIAGVRENDASSPSADGNPFYLVCSSEKLGSTQITYTTEGNAAYSFRVDVTLPARGFYSAAERSEANYLSTVDLKGANAGLTSIWYISEYSMASEKENVTVKAGNAAITNIEWIDEYTLKIPLPTDITDIQYWLYIFSGEKKMASIRITQPEQPSGGNDLPPIPDATLSDLPTYAFFGTQTRERNYYLPHVVWQKLKEGDGDTNQDNRFIWLVSEAGFTLEQQSGITVTTSGEEGVFVQYEWIDRGTGVCDLRIAIPMPKRTYNVIVKQNDTVLGSVPVEYKAIGNTSTIDNLVIGFTLQEAGVTTVTTNILGSAALKTEGPYAERRVTSLVAATYQNIDGTATYVVDEDVTKTLKINQLWLGSVNGDESTFSLDANRYQPYLSDVSNNSITLYARGGHIGISKLCAEVTGMIGGESFTTTVSAVVELYFVAGGSYYRPDTDTTEALNAYLQELAQTINPYTLQGTIYSIHLGDTTYNGTLVLPEEFQGNNIIHIVGSHNTIIQGGIDLNTAAVEQIRNVHFAANDKIKNEVGITRALYGGGVWMVNNCSFYGYDIALDSSSGLVNAYSGNVFVNNEIAACVDLADVTPTEYSRNLHREYWKNNTFINNGTAVQVLSLHTRVPAYHFRIYDSNFINNGTDVDARCGSTLYMYRNYFGRYKEVDGHRPTPGKHHTDRHNGRDDLRLDDLLNARTLGKLESILDHESQLVPAKISTANNTKVVTNPRWMYPVKGWWGHNILMNDVFFPEETDASVPALMSLSLEAETEYEDILVSDWSAETTILNEEAGELLLDAAAFATVTEKTKIIAVLDTDEQTLGTWAFPDTVTYSLRSAPAVAGSFNAGLTVDRSVAGQISVTVLESEVLTSKTPILSIPCDRQGTVTLGDTVIDSVSEDGHIYFQVAQAGTYVITLESVTAEYNADAGTVTLSNVQAGVTVVLAAYHKDQMVYIDMQVAQANDLPFTIELPEDLAADTIRLFFLTSDWQPVDKYESWPKQ